MSLRPLLLLFSATLAAQTPFPLSLNGDVNGFAFQPDFAQDRYIWNSYFQGAERILTATATRNGRGRVQELSPGRGVYYKPVLAGRWAFWSTQRGREWKITGREQEGASWKPAVDLADGLMPAAISTPAETALAWEDGAGRIRARVFARRRWSAPVPVSDAADSHRPALSILPEGEVWVFWDAWTESEYAVYGRRLLPSLGTAARLSPTGRSCLNTAARGALAAWVSTRDVEGGGVLDHWDTLQATVRRKGVWMLPDDVADLRFGLLAQIEPPGHMSGYSGRRRHPMLVEAAGAQWVLWERKSIHDGPSQTPGQLCGRSWRNGEWSPPVVLHEGMVDYRVPSDGRAEHGKLTVLAKNTQHGYSSFGVDLNAGREIRSGEWPGWKVTRLPAGPAAPRQSIMVDGKRLNLYWGDLHVHSALTPDAEGEPDELLHYGRDKARLDVMVISDNDANSWMNRHGSYRNHLLTASRFALSGYYSRRFTQPGRFVALPGYEWSQRTDDDKPNHRTIIYAGDYTPIVRHPENGGDFQDLCDAVEAAGGVMNTQHEVYRLVNRPCDANIEVASGWNIFFQQPEKIHGDLTAGYRVGFVATSDGHRRDPGAGGGLTAIYAPELTPQAVLEALREHRVYATNGSRTFLDARANGRMMGQDLVSSGPVELSLKVTAPGKIARAVLVRDSAEIHVAAGDGRRAIAASFTDRPAAGAHWYYWRVELEGSVPGYPGNMKAAEGTLAWSSPHRVVMKFN
ncbi:MAG TPA: hypothetical protein VL285_16925 [Bryobacteraceae bacterium]|nr:hypothetical protein [Bryobacteraceae bacterium]